jgi:hypothetical protein
MSKRRERDLPSVLVLKRAFIQRFPNGQQVALYHSDHLDQYITVPLDGSQFSNTTESVLERLKEISEEDSIQTLVFADLSEININKECADIILTYLESNEELIEQVGISEGSFIGLLEKAARELNESITESEEKESQDEIIN